MSISSKEEISKIFLILIQVMGISFVILIYLWQHFNYSTLFHEIQEMKQKKRKILLGIEQIRLESSRYSSVHRIESLFPEYSSYKDTDQKTSQRITTLKIPPIADREKKPGSRTIKYK